MNKNFSDLEAMNKRLIEEIKKHRRTTEELNKNKEILESIFAGTQLLIAYMDANFNFIRVNKAYALSGGHALEYYEGKNHFDLYPHEENNAIFKRVVETGEPFSIYEKPFIHPGQPDRQITYWDWSLQPVKGADGRVEGLIMTGMDATDRKLSEKRLQKTELKYLEILKKSLDGFVRMNPEGRFIEFNKAFRKMIGYGTAKLSRMTYQDITPDSWHAMESRMFAEARNKGRTPFYEKEFLKKDGAIIQTEIQVYWSPHGRDTEGELWLFVHDITEKKELEYKQNEYLQMLEKSNEALEEFAYVTSHDLQEPLRKIQTFGSRIDELYREALDERGRDYLRRMINAATRMRTLIEALLTYSRIKTRKKSMRPVDMNEVMRDVLSNLETLIQNTDGIVTFQALPTLEADYLQMVQLIQNTVGNALKFHQPDTPPRIEINAEITPKSKRFSQKKSLKNSRCIIRIKDNGIGFQQMHSETIFNPFQRLHGRSEYEGVGMGLAICRKIAQRHGGTIEAKSTPGQGTVFTIVLPLEQAETVYENGKD